MKIKRFQQLYENLNQDQIKKIYDEFMVYINSDDEDELGYDNSDLFDFAGEIANKYDMSLTDIQELLDTYPNDWNIQTFFGDLIEQDRKEKDTAAELDEYIRKTLGKYGVKVNDDAIQAVKEILNKVERSNSL